MTARRKGHEQHREIQVSIDENLLQAIEERLLVIRQFLADQPSRPPDAMLEQRIDERRSMCLFIAEQRALGQKTGGTVFDYLELVERELGMQPQHDSPHISNWHRDEETQLR